MNISLIELLNALLLISGITAVVGIFIKNNTLIYISTLILIISGLSLGYIYNTELDDATLRFTQLNNSNMSDSERLVLIHKICSGAFSREEYLGRLERQAWDGL